MKFLSNYFDFIFESVAKKTMRLHYSEEFRSLLSRISKKNGMAQLLLLAEDSNQVSDIYTLIDVTEKNDTISFIQVNRILRGTPDIKTYSNSDVYFLPRSITNDKSNEFWKRGRTEITIGRWLRRIVVDVYKSSVSDADIEKFVNQYKSAFDGEDTNLEVVQGDEIKKWYLESNYEIVRGQLGNSCMRYARCQDFFDIYTKNPEVCQLLIMRSDKSPDKIVGRSLLWNLKNGEKYQDRIYTILDSDKEIFSDWAEKNGYKTYDSSYSNLEVQLGEHKYEKFPYMDTFVSYSPTKYLLSNDEDLWPDSGYYSLQDTSGGYRSDDVVYSEWSDDYISRERAVYCNNVSTYLDRNEAKWLEYVGEWAAPDDSISYSEYHDEYFYADDVVYSELLSDILYPKNQNVIEVIINSNGDTDYCVKSRTDLYIKVNDDFYSRRDCIKDPFTKEYKFKDKDYQRELDIKLMSEFGIERSDDTLDKSGNPSFNILSDVTQDLKKRLLSLKLTDTIKSEFEENRIYKEQVRGVYWGLHKDDMPDEEDMFALLKSFMVTNSQSRYSNRYTSAYLSDIMGKFIFFRSEEMNKFEKKFRSFHSAGVLRQMIRVCESFDYSKFPDDIYKRYLFITI